MTISAGDERVGRGDGFRRELGVVKFNSEGNGLRGGGCRRMRRSFVRME